MILTAASPGLGLLAQVVGLAVLGIVFTGCCRWFWRRWDRLTRHRFVRWHRHAWRDETEGHMSIYQDAICRCCRTHWRG